MCTFLLPSAWRDGRGVTHLAPRTRLEGDWLPMSPNPLRPRPTRPAGPDQLMVVRDHAGLVQALREAIPAGRNVTLLVDERHGERRRRTQPVREERRRGERRARPTGRENG